MLVLAERGVTSIGERVMAEARAEFGDGFGVSALRNARRVLLADRHLLEQVRDGETTLYFAFETVTRGVRQTCPTCHGEGHIFTPMDVPRVRRRRPGERPPLRRGSGGGGRNGAGR